MVGDAKVKRLQGCEESEAGSGSVEVSTESTQAWQEEPQTTKLRQEFGRESTTVCRHQGSHRGASLSAEEYWTLGCGPWTNVPLLGLQASLIL